MRGSKNRDAQVFLVASAGGHLMQLLLLKEVWRDLPRLWVTNDAPDARSMLQGERAVFGDEPSSRSIRSLVSNAGRAFRLLKRHRPRAILTTGAAIAVPFAWLGRAFGADVIYVESVTRIETPSLTLRMIRPVATHIYVQWPELAEHLAGAATYVGTILPPQ